MQSREIVHRGNKVWDAAKKICVQEIIEDAEDKIVQSDACGQTYEGEPNAY